MQSARRVFSSGVRAEPARKLTPGRGNDTPRTKTRGPLRIGERTREKITLWQWHTSGRGRSSLAAKHAAIKRRARAFYDSREVQHRRKNHALYSFIYVYVRVCARPFPLARSLGCRHFYEGSFAVLFRDVKRAALSPSLPRRVVSDIGQVRERV